MKAILFLCVIFSLYFLPLTLGCACDPCDPFSCQCLCGGCDYEDGGAGCCVGCGLCGHECYCDYRSTNFLDQQKLLFVSSKKNFTFQHVNIENLGVISPENRHKFELLNAVVRSKTNRTVQTESTFDVTEPSTYKYHTVINVGYTLIPIFYNDNPIYLHFSYLRITETLACGDSREGYFSHFKLKCTDFGVIFSIVSAETGKIVGEFDANDYFAGTTTQTTD